MQKDTFKTLAAPSPESLVKDRGSKFLGYGYPITTEEESKERLEQLWKQHPKASHICYAWQLGKRYEHYRANDDGEPNNSAGMPIYGQLQSAGITNVLVAVVRYYGGTNLGVGGLITAYKTCAQLTLESGNIVTRTIKITLRLQFEYALMNVAMRIIKEQNLKITDQQMHLNCTIDLAVRELKLAKIKARFEAIHGMAVEVLDN
ncbi:IMPACT family protein [Flavimarina sp. Hel_I_48]|uniref:IMPACT family protein n=1 Tax=Flavimarina sp. Hel_I_48 TaxID=1392488 RepID=UPI0004DFA636|nr:YigZ family protein [Flavimarina sp. Hel_I_48]